MNMHLKALICHYKSRAMVSCIKEVGLLAVALCLLGLE